MEVARRRACQSCIVLCRPHSVMVTLYKARAVGMESHTHYTIEPTTAESKAWKNGLKPPRAKPKELQGAGKGGSSLSPESEGSWSHCFIPSRSSREGKQTSEGTLGRLQS